MRKHSRTEAKVEVEPRDTNTQATLCLEKGTKQDEVKGFVRTWWEEAIWIQTMPKVQEARKV